MKVLCGACVLAILCLNANAIPPRGNNRRPQNFEFFQSVELKPPAPNSPYTTNGWQPARKPFVFPSRQEEQPSDSYGPPSEAYGPPQPQPETTTNRLDYTTINAEIENIRDSKRKNEKQIDSSIFKNTDRGFYYVQLPDGRLQRVVYMTSADLQNMAYTARVQYEDIDPVPAPLYSALKKVPVLPGDRLIVPAGERIIIPQFN